MALCAQILRAGGDLFFHRGWIAPAIARWHPKQSAGDNGGGKAGAGHCPPPARRGCVQSNAHARHVDACALAGIGIAAQLFIDGGDRKARGKT